MMNKATCLLPMLLLACSGDVFTSQGVLPATVVAPSEDAGANVAQTNAPDVRRGNGCRQPTRRAGDHRRCTGHTRPCGLHQLPEHGQLELRPNGGWTGNMCPCECFEGLTQQAIDHCGQNGCTCVPSKFPKNPGLSCIKSAQ